MRTHNIGLVALLCFLIAFGSTFCSTHAHAETIPVAAVSKVINKLPIAWVDRADSRKPEQLETIARSIAEVASDRDIKWNYNDRVSLAAYLLAVGYHESRYRISIHSGVKKAYSYGVWQIVPFAHHVTRADVVGLSYTETYGAAFIAASILSKSFQCGGQPADIFTAYYGGVPCKTKWKTLSSRVATYYWARNELVKEMK